VGYRIIVSNKIGGVSSIVGQHLRIIFLLIKVKCVAWCVFELMVFCLIEKTAKCGVLRRLVLCESGLQTEVVYHFCNIGFYCGLGGFELAYAG
jgi:hypothetical protein